MNYKFSKKERLKRQKIIGHLFSKGKSVTVFPLRLVYIPTKLPESINIQVGFSVSKRNFKHAVQRNRIKRLMRETYRLNKAIIFNSSTTSHAFMFLYLGKELPDFHALNTVMISLLEKFKVEKRHV